MVVILRLRNKIILYAFILLCFMILSYSIYNIVVWKLDSNNTNKQIEEVQETVKVEEVIDTENTEIIEPVEEIPKSNPYWDYMKMNMIDINFNELKKINGVKDVEVTSNMIKSEILNLELEEDFYDIIGIDESAENDLEDMELYLQDGEIDLEKLKSGEEMILNFSMYADMYDIKVGDILSFELYDGEDIIKKDFKIQAITDGPGVFVIHNNIMDKLVKTNTRHSIGLTIEKNAYNEVKAYVESLVKANENLNGSYIDVEIASSELAIKITKIMGYSLVVLIGVIGFINLINSMITSIITRKKELGMLQAIGLTNKQLVQMLNKEAMFYTSFMLIGSLTIGNIIGYSAVQAMRKSGMSYAVYVLPINQMIIMIVCIVLAQFILTYLISKNFNKESLIDRVRYSE